MNGWPIALALAVACLCIVIVTAAAVVAERRRRRRDSPETRFHMCPACSGCDAQCQRCGGTGLELDP